MAKQKRNWRISIALVTFLGAVILISLYYIRPESEEEFPLEEIKVYLPWVKNPEFSFIDLGVRENFFRSQKIDISLANSRGSHEVVAAFDAGATKFGFLSGDSLVIARQQGVPIQALFVLFPSSPAVIVSLRDAKIEKPKDLLGKKIGVIKTSTTYPQFHALMAHAWKPDPPPRAGEDYFEVEAVAGGLAQLEAGQVDALTHYENFAPIQLEVAGYEIGKPIYFRDYGIDIYSTVFATTDEMIRDEEDLVQRIVDAMLDSLDMAVSQPQEALKALYQLNEDVTSMGPPEYIEKAQTVAHALATSRSESLPLGHMDADGWARTEETLRRAGQAGNLKDNEYYFNRSFLDSYTKRPRAER